MKPKVLHIIDTHFVGGAGKVLLQFLKNRAHSQIESFVGCFRYRNPPSTEFIDAVRSLGYPLALFRQRSFLDPLPFWHVWSYLNKGGFSLLETHGYKANFIAWGITRFNSIPWIAVTHGWTDENRRMRLYNRLDRWLLRYADLVITVSPQLQKEMCLLRGEKKHTQMVLNAVDPDFIRYGGEEKAIIARYRKSTNTLLLGVFGRLSPEKGHHILFQACRGLVKEHNAVLIVVGDGPERAALEQLRSTLDLEEHIFFTGQRQAMGDYYRAIDLLVLPSLSEGLPFVMLEAMVLHKPVLASDVGAVSKVIRDGENGWLVTAGDVDAMRRKLAVIIADRDGLKSMGARAKQSLEPDFMIGRQQREMLSLYHQMLTPENDETQ